MTNPENGPASSVSWEGKWNGGRVERWVDGRMEGRKEEWEGG